MKTVASVLALTVMATAAHAQVAYETMATSSTQTVGDVTTNVQTQYISTTTMVPVAVGDAPATPALTADNSVTVKMPTGDMLTIADSAESPWNKDSRLNGYDRFTFDPESGAFVASKGDDKFASNWDDNGNRIVKKPAPAPKKAKKKVVKTEAVQDTTTTTETPTAETPAEETPAAEAPAKDAPAMDATAKDAPSDMPATAPAH